MRQSSYTNCIFHPTKVGIQLESVCSRPTHYLTTTTTTSYCKVSKQEIKINDSGRDSLHLNLGSYQCGPMYR